MPFNFTRYMGYYLPSEDFLNGKENLKVKVVFDAGLALYSRGAMVGSYPTAYQCNSGLRYHSHEEIKCQKNVVQEWVAAVTPAASTRIKIVLPAVED